MSPHGLAGGKSLFEDEGWASSPAPGKERVIESHRLLYIRPKGMLLWTNTLSQRQTSAEDATQDYSRSSAVSFSRRQRNVGCI